MDLGPVEWTSKAAPTQLQRATGTGTRQALSFAGVDGHRLAGHPMTKALTAKIKERRRTCSRGSSYESSALPLKRRSHQKHPQAVIRLRNPEA